MTYIASIIVPEGIVALSDTRVTIGSEKLFNEKVWFQNSETQGNYFALFAGNRTWTDDTIHFLRHDIDWSRATTVRDFANQLGRNFKAIKDRHTAVIDMGIAFDIGLIVGGKGPADGRQEIRYVYQAGNDVLFSEYTPYFSSGQSSYGKFVLDDGLVYQDLHADGPQSSLDEAVRAAILSFHASQTSVNTVDYPIHLLLYPRSASGPEPIRKLFLDEPDLQPFVDDLRKHVKTFLKHGSLPKAVTALLPGGSAP